MALLIRNCDPNDVENIINVEKDVFAPEDVYSEALIRFLCVSCRESSYIAVYEGHVVGYTISCIEESGKMHVLSIAVLREYWGKGIGRSLMCAVINKALELGISTVYLEARKSNARALSFYQRLGFEVRHVLPNYYPNGEDGYLLAKELGGRACAEVCADED